MNENTNPDAQSIENTADDRPWESLDGNPVRVGYEVRMDKDDITRTGVVARFDEQGDPWTADGFFIGPLDLGTWYVRRPATEAADLARIILEDTEGDNPKWGLYTLNVYEARTLANAALKGDTA